MRNSFLEETRKLISKNIKNQALMRIYLSHKKKFLLVEGSEKNDASIYEDILNDYCQKYEIKIISIGTKSNFPLILKWFKNKTIIGFLDKDFGKEKYENSFFTSGYSIENYFVSEKIINLIFKNKDEKNKFFYICNKIYKKEYKKYSLCKEAVNKFLKEYNSNEEYKFNFELKDLNIKKNIFLYLRIIEKDRTINQIYLKYKNYLREIIFLDFNKIIICFI